VVVAIQVNLRLTAPREKSHENLTPLFEQLILWINRGLTGRCCKLAKCFPISRPAFRFHVLSRLSTTGQQAFKTESYLTVLIDSAARRYFFRGGRSGFGTDGYDRRPDRMIRYIRKK
jgi:hypothetical protein